MVFFLSVTPLIDDRRKDARMKQMLLVFAALCFTTLALATPATAQNYPDPDPCFDASLNKSQYYACLADGPGGYGPGGSSQPACMSCVTGVDGNGLPISLCKDSTLYLESRPQYAGCQAWSSFRSEERRVGEEG